MLGCGAWRSEVEIEHEAYYYHRTRCDKDCNADVHAERQSQDGKHGRLFRTAGARDTCDESNPLPVTTTAYTDFVVSRVKEKLKVWPSS
jgi:hypothetical protein